MMIPVPVMEDHTAAYVMMGVHMITGMMIVNLEMADPMITVHMIAGTTTGIARMEDHITGILITADMMMSVP